MKKTQTQAFSNLIGAATFLLIGVWALIQTYSFAEIKNTYVQPATFPRIMIVGMLIFSVVVLVQSILKLGRMKENDPAVARAASLNLFKDKGVQAALAVVALCILFVLLFKPLGYVLCSTLISLAMMWMIGKRNWLQMILVSVLVPLGMWLVFYKVLTVNIPMGPLDFLCDLIDKL